MTEKSAPLIDATISQALGRAREREALRAERASWPEAIDFTKPFEAPASGVRVDAAGNVTITWGRYDYHIEAHRIATPERLLGWIVHIGEKAWPAMTPARIARLVEKIAHRRGWDIWKEGK